MSAPIKTIILFVLMGIGYKLLIGYPSQEWLTPGLGAVMAIISLFTVPIAIGFVIHLLLYWVNESKTLGKWNWPYGIISAVIVGLVFAGYMDNVYRTEIAAGGPNYGTRIIIICTVASMLGWLGYGISIIESEVARSKQE